MATLDSNGPLRKIGWNSIEITLPGGWETIVSGDRNLLIEQNFKPIIDLRWEQDLSGRDLTEVFLSIRNVLGKRSGSAVNQVEIPEELTGLENATNCIAFSWGAAEGPVCHDTSNGINGLLWHCPNCGTIIIAQLYKHPRIGLTEIGSVLGSLNCHQAEEAEDNSFWSIQDFSLSLPSSWKISAHSFKAGFTRLTFKDQDTRLHFCRLAPAEQRLEHDTMPQLLTNLLGGESEYDELQQSSHLYECMSSPPIAEQMLKRLKRQPPFRWGRIWHNQPANRLLSVIAESSHPIDLEKIHKLCERYEIIHFQKEKSPPPDAETEQG